MYKNKQGICKACGNEDLVGKDGKCRKCMRKEWYLRKKNAPALQEQYMPCKKMIVIWETTDGCEFNTETEALRHQIEINFRTRRNRA